MRNSDFGMRNENPDRSSIPHSEFRNPHLIDPDNRWLGRMPVRRLDAEQVRDALFAVSGELTPDAGVIVDSLRMQ